MARLNLSTLDLGPFDAKDDDNLQNYFVRFGDFERFLDKSQFIAVGAKGTGKSAIRKYLEGSRTAAQQLVVALDDSYSISLSHLKTSSPAEIKNKMKGYLTGLAIQCLTQSPELSARAKRKLKGFANEVGFIRRMLKPLKFKAAFAEYALEELFPQQKQPELLKVIDPEVATAIRDCLGDRDLWILIDDVDTVFTSDDDGLSLRLVEGLVYAASDLTIGTFKKSVFVLVLVRSDVYDRLAREASDLDRELQYIWHIVWSEDELRQFLAERIRWALSGRPDLPAWRHWLRLFDVSRKRGVTELQDYLIERLMNGPRDLLLIVDMARRRAVGDGVSKISLSHVYSAESEYGEEKLLEISRSFRRSYPGINPIVDYLFRGRQQCYARSELEDLVRQELLTHPQAREAFAEYRWFFPLTPFRFIQVLYRVGIVGYWDPAHKRYVYALEKAEPEMALLLSPTARFKIHSALKKYLELRG
jgi:hypothetical protein